MERTRAKFQKHDKVLLLSEWGEPEVRFVHKRTWHEQHGWIYNVGSLPNVTHRCGLATVAEGSLARPK